MQNPFFPETLRAAAELVVVLDRHRFGAGLFVIIVVAIAVTVALA